MTLLGSGHTAEVIRLVAEACAALDGGGFPRLLDDGSGGTYVVDDIAKSSEHKNMEQKGDTKFE